MPTVHAETLKRAAEIVGGEQQLALRLEVTPSHLALWIRGLASPPPYIFLKAVDLVTDHEVSQLQQPAHSKPKGSGPSPA